MLTAPQPLPFKVSSNRQISNFCPFCGFERPKRGFERPKRGFNCTPKKGKSSHNLHKTFPH